MSESLDILVGQNVVLDTGGNTFYIGRLASHHGDGLWLAPEGSDAVEESLSSARGRTVKFAHSLAPGSYVLAGTAPGLVSGHAAVRVFDGLAAEATLEMAPPRSVTGRVTDRRGAPVAGATVAWRQRPACSCGQGLPETAGADGRFVLEGLPAAGKEVRVLHEP